MHVGTQRIATRRKKDEICFSKKKKKKLDGFLKLINGKSEFPFDNHFDFSLLFLKIVLVSSLFLFLKETLKS